ncbi:MAG: aspartate/glutamate racemase family protein [Candidatus Caldatribacteriota bacterium]
MQKIINRILWINPVNEASSFDQLVIEFINKVKRVNTQVDVISLKQGPMHLNYYYYNALILTDILHLVKRAEKKGYNAVIIGCFYDPGLQEAREITDKIVVSAPAEASLLIATTLGYRFSIIVASNKCIPKMYENVVNHGLINRLASFESVNLEVNEFQKDKKETLRRIYEAAKQAVHNKLAEVIILGCTMQFGFYEELQKDLKVPVIDSIIAPLKYAEFMVELRRNFGWGHSKICGYESPPISEIKEWKLSDQYPEMRGLW